VSGLDVYADSACPAALAIFVIAASMAALLAGIAAGFVRALRRNAVARRAEASIGKDAQPLVEGRHVVLSGLVRHLAEHDVAVKVTVTQAGTEAERSGTWSHSWIEIDRDIIVAPFLLELPTGELVRVDPPKNVDVADDLDQKVWTRVATGVSAELARATEMNPPKPPKQSTPPLRPAQENQENVVKRESSKGEVRPDGPGDDTAPVKPASENH
jgi:hypothetical protein